MGSSNGTVVNGEQLEPEVLAKPLKDGDRIKLGLQSELLVQVVEVLDENNEDLYEQFPAPALSLRRLNLLRRKARATAPSGSAGRARRRRVSE